MHPCAFNESSLRIHLEGLIKQDVTMFCSTDDFDQLNRARKEHAKQLADLQHEVELTRKKAELEKYKEQLQFSSPSPKTTASGPMHAEVSPLRPSIQHAGSPLRDSDTSLDPAPYDPKYSY